MPTNETPLTSYGQKILAEVPTKKPGIGERTLIERVGGTGSSFNSWQRMIQELETAGYLQRDPETKMLWKTTPKKGKK